MVLDSKVFKGIIHYIHSLEEFLEKYPKIRPLDWREGELGDWVLTDEGYVCEILYKKATIRSKVLQTFVTTVTGTYIVEGKVPMNNEIKGNISLVVPKSGRSKSRSGHNSRFMRKSMSRGDKLFTQSLMVKLGQTPVVTGTEEQRIKEEAYRIAFPKARSSKYITQMSNELYETTRIQSVLNEQIQKTLDDKKVTFGRVVDWMTDLIEDTKMNKQGSWVIPATVKAEMIKEFLQLLGTKSPTKLIENRSWYVQKGQIGEGELAQIGQEQKTTKTITEVGSDQKGAGQI